MNESDIVWQLIRVKILLCRYFRYVYLRFMIVYDSTTSQVVITILIAYNSNSILQQLLKSHQIHYWRALFDVYAEFILVGQAKKYWRYLRVPRDMQYP